MISCISLLCPRPVLLLCTTPGLLPSIGAPLQTSCRPRRGLPQAGPRRSLQTQQVEGLLCEVPCLPRKTSKCCPLWSLCYAAVTAVFPTAVALFWIGKLLLSSGFGKMAPFPGRSSNIKGAFCNETETEKSCRKVSLSVTPCAQEQVFRLLHSYPCQH